MRGGTVWGYEKKGRNAAEQPNTDVWKVEKCYTNPKTLVHNWHETRAKAEVSAKVYSSYISKKMSSNKYSANTKVIQNLTTSCCINLLG